MDFKTIEDAIISELKTSVPYLKAVETYAGQLDRDIASLPVRFPAAFVAYEGSNFSAGDLGSSGHESCTFSIFVCARDLRGRGETLKGAAPGDKGAYDAVNDIVEALEYKSLGLNIEPLKPMRASLLFAGAEVVAYSLAFVTGFEHM